MRGLLAYDPAQPLEFRVLGERREEAGTVAARVIEGEFRSQDRTVRTTVIQPAREVGPGELRAGVVFLHWDKGDRTEFLAEAIALAGRGGVSVLIDLPWAVAGGEINPARAGHDQGVFARAVVDARRAIDLLASRGDVDAHRVGIVGHGQGAQVGAVVAGADARPAAFVLIAGVPSYVDRVLHGEEAQVRALRAAMGEPRVKAFAEELRPLDAERHIRQVRSDLTLLQLAKHDREVPAADGQRFADALGALGSVKWYVCGHEMNHPQASEDRTRWLIDRLKLASDEAIQGADAAEAGAAPEAAGEAPGASGAE